MSKQKSIVLLSGGLDSLVNAQKAFLETDLCLILTFDYGQEAAEREIEAAALTAQKMNVPHRVVRLDWLPELDKGLTKGMVPDYDPARLDDLAYASKTAKQVWVPNRNGVMINIAAAVAESMDVDFIVVGFNRDEAATFPDNSAEFIKRTNAALEYSTLSRPRLRCYTIDLNKSGILRLGIEIGAPLEYLWSCYHAGEHMCGECESCRRLKRALVENNYLESFNRKNTRGIR